MTITITPDRLMHGGIRATQAAAFASALALATTKWAIPGPARAMFLAQCAHESAGFTRLEEDLYYRDASRIRAVFGHHVEDYTTAARLVRDPRALANHVYANRNGNGNEASGDGYLFRGRGLIQVTGRDNYQAYGHATDPDWLGQVVGACDSAGWFWATAGLNESYGDIEAVTRRINGGLAGIDDRRAWFDFMGKALATPDDV